MWSAPSMDARAKPLGSNWPMYGGDVSGSRNNAVERLLSVRSVTRGLGVKWRFTGPGGPVYGTPAVVDGRVYAADVAGNVFALDATTGAPVWLSHVGPVAAYPFVVTSSVLVTDRLVIVGDQSGIVHALDRSTGVLQWVRRPNAAGFPAIWGSPSLATVRTRVGNRALVLVPVASNEETFTTTEQQPCCFSRGSLAALDPETGKVVWQTYMVSDAESAAGAAGVSIWTMPVYDRASNLVYVSTGNNFANRDSAPTTDTSDAIIAIDAATGRIVWKNQRTPDDTWVSAYTVSADHMDADFGDTPAIFRLANGRKVVAAGQKSGFMHVLDAKTGALVSMKEFLPAGGLGGFFADSAESHGVLFANGNRWADYGGGETGGIAAVITGQVQGATAPKSGDVVAIRADRRGTLTELWRFSRPDTPMMGAVAVANSVVYVHASKEGELYALDERTGRVLAHVRVGPAINGPSVADGRVYMGFGDVAGFASPRPTAGGVVAVGLE
jgi:polyvinyl alcohol dehydrogenase (cytochrome)